MYKHARFLRTTIIAIAFFTFIHSPSTETHAVEILSIEITHAEVLDWPCNEVAFYGSITARGIVDDLSGQDHMGLSVWDPNGHGSNLGSRSIPVGEVYEYDGGTLFDPQAPLYFMPGLLPPGIGRPTARPLTLVIYEVDYYEGGADGPPGDIWGDPIAAYVFDPADFVPACADEFPLQLPPYWPPGVNVSGGSSDDRINNFNDTPAAIYTNDGGIQVYGIDDDGNGFPTISVTAEELANLPDQPDENLLIASFGDIALYRLTTGEYQVNVGPDIEGKVQVFIFDGIPPTNVYRADYNIYDILDND